MNRREPGARLRVGPRALGLADEFSCVYERPPAFLWTLQ